MVSIRSNIGTGVINIFTTDTVMFSPGLNVERYQVGNCNVYNTNSVNVVLSVYISPDTTSAAGNLVEKIEIRAGEEEDINSITGQGYTLDNIIVKANNIGLNGSLTHTDYDDGS